MKKWNAFMDKYYPDGDKTSSFTVYGYGVTQTLEKVLKASCDNLTREGVMASAASIEGRRTGYVVARHHVEYQCN